MTFVRRCLKKRTYVCLVASGQVLLDPLRKCVCGEWCQGVWRLNGDSRISVLDDRDNFCSCGKKFDIW